MLLAISRLRQSFGACAKTVPLMSSITCLLYCILYTLYTLSAAVVRLAPMSCGDILFHEPFFSSFAFSIVYFLNRQLPITHLSTILQLILDHPKYITSQTLLAVLALLIICKKTKNKGWPGHRRPSSPRRTFSARGATHRGWL